MDTELSPDLLDILVEWEDRRSSHPSVTLADICGDRPELLEDAERHLALARTVDAFLTRISGNDLALFPTIPGYEILRPLGEGGMGTVYLARDKSLMRQVAIKIPKRAVTEQPGGRARFMREARLLATLRHPGLVSVFAADFVGDRSYLVMELFDGGSLAAQKQDYLHRPARIAVLLQQIAITVDYAHRQGVIHRDLKPANILIDATGRPRVADFGVAALIADDADAASNGDTPPAVATGASTEITTDGRAAGTLAYSAPEMYAPARPVLGPALDIWSLGVIGYELLVGRVPFPNGAYSAGDAPTIQSGWRADARGLGAIISRCLARDPAHRYATAAELATALAKLQTRRRRRRAAVRYGLPALTAALAVTLLGAAVWPPTEEARHQTRSTFVQREMAKGLSVPLIDESIPRPSHRIRLGHADTRTQPGADGTLSITAGRPALVELVTDPGIDRYRLSAEVQQSGHLGEAELGIYFDHHCSADFVHTFGCVRFAEFGPAAHVITHPNNLTSMAKLDWFCLLAPVATGPDWHVYNGANIPIRPSPAIAPPGPWRQIEVEVTPTTVVAWFDGKFIGEMVRSRIQRWATGLPFIAPRLSGQTLDVSSRGGVGLFVFGCEMVVRNYRIVPIFAPLP